ncbi:tetratricopeptide repeat protein [Streptomyces anulatus]|uniref:tetratricopeptide repeat protein n=1 Tax=Streptomyces anulatus TaxID=1892 RepID=UPI003660AD8B
MNLEYLPQPSLALARIGEHFLKDMQYFGRLRSMGPLSLEKLTPYGHKSVFIVDFFTLLQTQGGLRLSRDEDIPFYYNLKDWASVTAPAGYCGRDGEVTPSALAMSLFEGWDLRTTGSFHARLFKAALWRVKEHGLRSALGLMFDLYQAGFSGRPELYEVAELLLSGRCSASSDDDMVRRFLNGFPPDAARWHALIPSTDWIRPTRDGDEWVSLLLEQAATAIQRVRESPDFDEWWVRQMQLHGLLLTVSMLVKRFGGTGRLSLPWKTRLAQWEEIEADAFSFIGLAMTPGLPLPTWEMRANSIQGLAKTYRDRAGRNWKRRFLQERLMVPDGIRNIVLDTPEVEVPQRWRALSRRVIRPWMAVLRESREPDFFRVIRHPPEKLVNHTRIQQAMRSLGVEDSDDQVRHVRRVANAELGMSSAEDRRIISALNEAIGFARAQCSEEEQLQKFGDIDRLFRAQKYGAALVKAEDLLHAYPYSKRALDSVARLHEVRGNLQQALEHLIDSIALEPMNPRAWRSLADVLNRRGNEREAQLAVMCGRLIRI